ncbi:S4 domain-containing protein YaaA [Paenibacillus agilis]|uniref:S4 domain-containing protein YaaA n=1 Tax=Paenibacillus agilis TaxID=3020863 RepID=A0A559IQB1_9BACL|nr:S4 domain-containing protein YaaA [Paenibacillus agilis]TVX89825.1 S4 domain-containing protein YaaA [Paenibacillus agilis]
MKSIHIQTDYITLGQFLKLADCVSTGGHVKVMLAEQAVRVNAEPEDRRGRKLRNGDTVEVKDCGTFLVVQTTEA